MKRVNLILALYCVLVSIGFEVYAQDYDYSFTAECLARPLKPQYNGGIVVNPELNDGLKGWSTLGDAKIVNKISKDGNSYIVASDRKGPHHGFSQNFQLEKDTHYIVSGWVQVSHGEEDVAVLFETKGGYKHVASAIAKAGCWSMFKGGLTVLESSGPAKLYFMANNTSVHVMADSISVKSFSPEEWKSHQHQSIQKVRKRNVTIHVVDSQGKPLPNATISVVQGRPGFPFGCAMNKNILNNGAYQNWFFSRFKYTVFENEMKWYSNEISQGREDYSASDALVNLAKSHGVSIRGQNVLWDDPKLQPSWVPSLSPPQLSAAANHRVGSVVKRYSGQLIHWDVVNENLHITFFEDKLGAGASATFYKLASQNDNKAIMFLNDYNTLEQAGDKYSTPAKYLAKINQIKSGFDGPLGIGLEGHFHSPDFANIRTAIDTLASAKLPMWITELDVARGPNQAQFLEQIINELVAHPAIGGIVMWSAWSPQGCYRMCLTDNNFKNLATGDVVDGAMKAMASRGFVGTTNEHGHLDASLFHGDYEVMVNHTSMAESSFGHTFTVTKHESHETVLSYKVTVA